MKFKKPSDYRAGFRFLKKENIDPKNGSVLKISDIDDVDKSIIAGEHDWRIRLTLNSAYWFELNGSNHDSALEILGDDFDRWFGRKLGFVIADFTAKDGSEKQWIKIVPAPAIELKVPRDTETREPEPLGEEIPFD
jgi:hypothetical protein